MEKPNPDQVTINTKKLKEDLEAIVERFNKDFAEWSKATKCAANFGWVYPEGQKAMAVSEIVFHVYHAPAPGEKTLSQIIGKGPPKA